MSIPVRTLTPRSQPHRPVTQLRPAERDEDPPMVQLLSPDGQRHEHPEYPLDITDEQIGQLYRDLVLVRRYDTEAVALQRQGELGLWASLLGQEGAQIGAGYAARAQDMLFPSYREHGVAWVRGVDPIQQLGLFRGTTMGGWDPYEHNVGLYTIVIGDQTLHAAGYAMGMVRDGVVGTGDPDVDAATMVFFGDGATSQGSVSEAFIWAASQRLPLVFFCQNNQWAISAPVRTQTPIPLYQRAQGFGFPGVRIDGNDVLASLAVTRAALDDARAGDGPTLIEAFTYRMNPHTTSDDPTRYRANTDTEAWRSRDPLTRVERYLRESADFSEGFFDELQEESDELAHRIRTETRALPDPSPSSVFEHVYTEPTEELRSQRTDYDDYLHSVGVTP